MIGVNGGIMVGCYRQENVCAAMAVAGEGFEHFPLIFQYVNYINF